MGISSEPRQRQQEQRTNNQSSSQGYKMKTVYVLLLVVLAAIALEAKPREEGNKEERILQSRRPGKLTRAQAIDIFCPHCVKVKSGCACVFYDLCKSLACSSTGSCTKANCVKNVGK